MKFAFFSFAALLALNAAWADNATVMQGLYQKNFNMPSGNVFCGGDVRAGFTAITPQNGVFCSMNSKLQEAKPRPRDCDLDWQATFVLPAEGKPEVVWECAGDTPYGTSTTLQYGETIKGNGWQCISEHAGLQCTNQDNHGFKLNRQEQTLF